MPVIRTFAGVRITSTTGSSARVTLALGITPTDSFERGDPVSSRSAHVRRHSQWRIESGDREGPDLEGQLAELSARLLPHRDAIRELMSTGYTMTFSCFVEEYEGQGGVILSPELLADLGRFPADLWLDIYASDADHADDVPTAPRLLGLADIAPLRTPRLRLDPLQVADAEELAPLLDDDALHRYTGHGRPTMAGLRRRYYWLTTGLTGDRTRRWFTWVLREDVGGRAVGIFHAEVGAPADSLTATVRWLVGADVGRRGYASEGGAAMLRWLREQGVELVVAYLDPHDLASAALARRLGLSSTGWVVDDRVRWCG